LQRFLLQLLDAKQIIISIEPSTRSLLKVDRFELVPDYYRIIFYAFSDDDLEDEAASGEDEDINNVAANEHSLFPNEYEEEGYAPL
jgi:hypothetical protein